MRLAVRWRCAFWSLAALSLPSLLIAGDVAAPGLQTKTAGEWYTITYPEKIAAGQTLELKVAYKGLKFTKGTTKLRCDLHWIRADGAKQGFFAVTNPAATVEAADGEVTFKVAVNAREGLCSVFPVFFATDDGGWQAPTLRIL